MSASSVKENQIYKTASYQGIEEYSLFKVIDVNDFTDEVVVEVIKDTTFPSSEGSRQLVSALFLLNYCTLYSGGDGLCAHELKDYVGFTDNYKYCTKCDFKQV